jgi:serine/threonine protein kinase
MQLVPLHIGSINDTGQLPGYLLGRVVGEGGFCKVRLGIHQVTGAKTAVKLIDKARLVVGGGTS